MSPPAFHFISGIPRTGSTLLAPPLKQNPALHANMTSPVGDDYRAARNSSASVCRGGMRA